MSVRMGAFDGDPGVRPSWRTHVAYAALWEPIPDDGLQRFPEGGPRPDLIDGPGGVGPDWSAQTTHSRRRSVNSASA